MQASSKARSLAAAGPCPIGRAAALLGDYWTVVILRQALFGRHRFEEFRTELGVADNILADRLSRLVEAGLLVRRPYRDARRTRDEYRLTESGRAAESVLLALAAWGEDNTPAPAAAPPLTVVHAGCGATVPPAPVCASCGRPLQPGAASWQVPWLPADAVDRMRGQASGLSAAK